MDDVIIVIIFGIVLTAVAAFWVITDSREMSERLTTFPSIFVALIMHIGISLFFHWSASNLDTLLIFFGVLTFIVGAAFATWAKYVMKESWGPPGQHDIGRQRTLVIWGPFLISRNPIYVGLLLMFIGSSMALQSFTIFLVPAVAYYFYTFIKKEEELLEDYFGEEYLGYKMEVPRFLVV